MSKSNGFCGWFPKLEFQGIDGRTKSIPKQPLGGEVSVNWKVRDKGKEEFSSAKTVSVSAPIGRSLRATKVMEQGI